MTRLLEDSSLAMVSRCLAAIAERDGHLRSFVSLDRERAQADARERDANSRKLSPLHGVPIAVKDIFDVTGMPTRANSRSTPSTPATADAHAVAQLRDHGAVILGKVQTFELAIGIPTDDDLFQPSVNPNDARRTPGGSSSGAAVAVAAGLCRISLASDTGGSIRGPAAYCGAVGFKPTHGRIPTAGMLALAPTLDHAGLLTRTAADLSRSWQPWRREGRPEPTTRLRIGVPVALIGRADVSPSVIKCFENALAAMRSTGWEQTSVIVPDADHVEGVYRTILAREAYEQHRATLLSAPDDIGRNARGRLSEGAIVGDRLYRAAIRGRDRIRSVYAGLFERIDLLAMPTTTDVAPILGAPGRMGPSPFCVQFNLSGQPSLSLPAGQDGDGMPIGLLLSAAQNNDEVLIAAAASLETAFGGSPFGNDAKSLPSS